MKTKYITASCLFLIATLAMSQTNFVFDFRLDNANHKSRLQSLRFTTPAYQKEALMLLLKEANTVARELNLPEDLPIVQSNLLEVYINPPRMTRIGFGNITTSNYTYYVTVGNKFSFLVKRNLEQDYDALKNNYLLPVNQMDTNAAYQTAIEALKAVSMDVDGLNRDCSRNIRAFTPEGVNGKQFVPVYWVSWAKNGSSVASVELFEPTKTIRQMHINQSQYILRPPLQVTNLVSLLATNGIDK